jgi:O-antigen/teichoic acid export membrane protein
VPELGSVVYQNALAWRVPVRTRACAAALRLALAAALVAAGARQAGPYVLAHAVSLSLGNVWLGLLARRELERGAAPRAALSRPALRAAMGELARVAWPLGLTAVVQQAYFYVDNLFVRALCGEEELGRYNAAVRLTSLLLMGGTLATSTALPWLARSWSEGRLAAAVAHLGQRLFAAAGLLLGALMPWSGALLAGFFGEPFRAAADSLRWLLISALVIHAGAVLYTGLLSTGASRAVLAIALGGLLVNLAANTWLVPRLGAEGAAIATLATESWIALAALVALLRRGTGAGPRPWLWLGGPASFALAWLASSGAARFVP